METPENTNTSDCAATLSLRRDAISAPQRRLEGRSKPTPSDWPRLSSSVFYQDAAAAIDWLCEAFGFEVRLKVEGDNGRIEHSELTYGGGACTQSIMFFVDDAMAHCAHARASGARIVEEPATHDYGEDNWPDLSYGALDPEDHVWWITQRLRNPPGRISAMDQRPAKLEVEFTPAGAGTLCAENRG
jgi:uncharacterized glyoxalase superfamily protein PhnB